MKKIPTLFERTFENHRVVGITDKITPGCEEAFLNGVPTVKIDGSCCAIIGGKFYKRYDAKKGKTPPEGAIPCCDPDPVTGHWPHWVPVNKDDRGDRWFVKAYEYCCNIAGDGPLLDGTYEAIGPHFQNNPYNYEFDMLARHGTMYVAVDRTFEGVKKFLEDHGIEGIVFWLNDEPVCKIKRKDFGLKWPVKE